MSLRYSQIKSILQYLNSLPRESREGYVAVMIAKVLTHSMFPSRPPKNIWRRGFNFEDVSSVFNLRIDDNQDSLSVLEVQPVMKLVLKRFNNYFIYDAIVKSKADEICNFLNLPKKSNRLIIFGFLLEQESVYKDILGAFGEVDINKFFKILSNLLDLSFKELKQILSPSSPLRLTKMLEFSQGSNEIDDRLDLSNQLFDYLSDEQQSIGELLSHFFQKAPSALNDLHDFEHLQEHQDFIVNALTQADFKPLNILIYGEPGSGKTQWVKAIAKTINKPLYQISTEDSDGDSLTGTERLGAFKVANISLSKINPDRKPVILFDEIEDVFPQMGMFAGLFGGMRGPKSPEKARLNELLESTQVTSFWLSNEVSQIDPAFIRRFDLVVEMKAPPKAQRKTIISNTLKPLQVSEQWLDSLANFKQITPGVLKTAANMVIHNQINAKTEVESHLERLLNQLLKAQGHSPVKIKQAVDKMPYDISLLNTESDLTNIIDGLQVVQQGRVCLYGIPGTGKTAFGKHLADQLDKPFIHKKPSDILSPYVGEMEQNLAAVFEEAEHENGVLQIDEVDSFLGNRANAQRSWEISQVNEMLTQLENYQGIIVVTTNRLTDMDEAVLRRFDLKIELKAMTNDQAWRFLHTVLTEQPKNESQIKARLQMLSPLTPGDFYAANRGLRLSGKEMTAENWLTSLENEVFIKPGYQKSQGIGFLSQISA